jgi:UV DNA damage endonuclease
MRIGYPCINTTMGCKSGRTFRLKSYSEDRLIETIENNLACLDEILRFNLRYKLLFFRITSDLIPFGSHPICRLNWQRHFRKQLKAIGDFIMCNNMRISMHPDQFTVINSVDESVSERSVRELAYHAEVLDSMGLGTSARIQIHVGGVYRDREKSRKRFARRFESLDERIKRRLVVENDDKCYGLNDCIQIHSATGIPVLFDLFHHEINNSGETIPEAFELFTKTWKKRDGLPMVDYSSQQSGKRQGKHAETLDLDQFRNFLEVTRSFDYDLMLEIKDKEQSALKAVKIASQDHRFSAMF